MSNGMVQGKLTGLPPWVSVSAAVLVPTVLGLVGNGIIMYGDVKQLQSDVQHINLQLEKHDGKDAHGKVREDLARHDGRLDAHEVRLNRLDMFAAEERYTEEDAKENNELLMKLFAEQQRTTHIELSLFREKLKRLDSELELEGPDR